MKRLRKFFLGKNSSQKKTKTDQIEEKTSKPQKIKKINKLEKEGAVESPRFPPVKTEKTINTNRYHENCGECFQIQNPNPVESLTSSLKTSFRQDS